MADSAVFDWVCNRLDEATSLSTLEARGSVRLALKDAGLEAASVDSTQMTVVLRKLMPSALASRGVEDAGTVCETLAGGLAGAALDSGRAAESPESVFQRLAQG